MSQRAFFEPELAVVTVGDKANDGGGWAVRKYWTESLACHAGGPGSN